jgi:hypothetical protein
MTGPEASIGSLHLVRMINQMIRDAHLGENGLSALDRPWRDERLPSLHFNDPIARSFIVRVCFRASPRLSVMPQGPMLIRRIISLNALLIVGVGIFGVLTDEPYWRAVGHTPSLYDYLFWLALALNGPSGLAADLGARHITDNFRLPFLAGHEWRFIIQYALWLLFIWPQWKAYDLSVRWCVGHPFRKILLYLAASGAVLIGCIEAYEAWEPSQRVGLVFIDRYYWTVRIAGLGLAGLVVVLYAQLLKNRMLARASA